MNYPANTSVRQPENFLDDNPASEHTCIHARPSGPRVLVAPCQLRVWFSFIFQRILNDWHLQRCRDQAGSEQQLAVIYFGSMSFRRAHLLIPPSFTPHKYDIEDTSGLPRLELAEFEYEM